jgi:uncharacterized membrane protein YkoI
MNSKNLKLVAAAAVVALGTAVTSGVANSANTLVAQATPQAAPAPGNAAAQQFTSLAKAVGLAEQRTSGKAKKAELDRKDGVYVYKVRTVSKDGGAKVYLDFRTGEIFRLDSTGFLGRVANVFDRDDRRKNEATLNALNATQVSITDAITKAEAHASGRAIEAKMKDNYGTVSFQVKVLVGNMKKRYDVDGATGNVTEVVERRKRKDRDDDDDDD